MRFTTVVLFLICSLSSYSQKKGDTKIIVEVIDTTNLFNKVAMAFYEKGFSLEQKDDQLKFIATDEKNLPKDRAMQMKLRAFIKDNTLIISGLIAINMDIIVQTKTKQWDVAEYRGMKGSAYMVTWEEMESIAKLFGDKISYSK